MDSSSVPLPFVPSILHSPEDSVVTGDMDFDGYGDVCDPNTDRDSCVNGVGRNPNDSHVVVGSYSDPTCDSPARYITELESNDSDGDLDGDGIVDAADAAAVLACEGADLTLEMPVAEPEFWVDGTVLYDPDLEAIFSCD